MWSNFLIEEKFDYIKEKADKLNKLIINAKDYAKTGGETQIIPVVIGENDKTVKIAEHLQSKGFYILPVRPPTVPVGSSRLRLSLTSDITFDEFKTVIDTINEVL